MANEEKKNQTQQKEPARRKKGFFHHFGGLLLLLTVVLVVVVLTTMEDGNHFSSLRRWLMYGDSGTEDNRYSYAVDQNHRFAMLGDKLLVVGLHEILLLRDDGTVLVDRPVQLAAPGISVGGGRAAVCDVGGRSLYILDGAGGSREMTTSAGYYAARLNGRGYLAVTEQKSGYKAAVTVYNAEGEKLFGFDSYDRYISEAVVTEDCRSLVAVSLEAVDGTFATTLLVYDLSQGICTGEYSIRDALVMESLCKGDKIVSLCDTRLSVIGLDGEMRLDYPYGNMYLHDYALAGDGFSALLLGRYRAGNVCQLTTFSDEGEKLASMEVTEEVLDLSAAGDYLAVLYNDYLAVYTRELHEYARLETTAYAGQVIMEEGGTAVLIAGTEAWRYLP